MKTFAIAAGFTLGAGLLTFALLPAGPALADSDVLCVQQELASRGFDPGPLDGDIGPETRDAAQAAGFMLSYDNAGAVCNDLRPTRTFSFTAPADDNPAFIERAEPRPFTSPAPQSGCPNYVIDPNDPCF